MSTLSISVIVPYRPDGAWRDRAWMHVVSRAWSLVVDEWPADAEIVISTPEPEGPGHPGDFNHPLAINRAAARARGDLLFIADADCLPDPSYPRLAAEAINAGEQWCLPRLYRKLGRPATEAMLGQRGPLVYGNAADFDWIGDSVSWAGCPAVPRDAFEDVGGYDERIAWWGADDVAFGLTMTTLYGNARRLEGVTHLWHPDPLEHNYGHERHASQQALVDRYIAAAGDPLKIRQVRDS